VTPAEHGSGGRGVPAVDPDLRRSRRGRRGIGGSGDDDPFEYRIQSPLTPLEFDNYTGVWLTNTEPAKYHVCTVVRTPNGNGWDMLRQHHQQAHGRGHAVHGDNRDEHIRS
jgi:Protein of unknown function (DUF3500)